MMRYISFMLITGLFCSCMQQRDYTLESPDKTVMIHVSEHDGQLRFSQTYRGDTIIGSSPVGLMIDGMDLTVNVEITGFNKSAFDETWQTVNGKNREVRNHYNEYVIGCRATADDAFSYDLVFRCYEDGFAYRYLVPAQESRKQVNMQQELTRLRFTGNFTYWAYNGERHNLGPLDRARDQTKLIRPPMVIKTGNGTYVSILEGEIIRYAPFDLNAEGHEYSVCFSLTPASDTLPVKTSWRSFIIGDRPGDLVESNLLVNLNEPCKIEDPSWIRPGKSLWDWRVWGYRAPDGFVYGMNTVSHKRFIDFASENNIQYLLMDADWYGPEFSEDSDPTSAREEIDIRENMAYARKKGVGIILYLNDVGAKKFGLERVLKQFSEWGAVGVKYGFMRSDDMHLKVRHTRKVVELCARYRLLVDFHDGPVPPSGDRRTWPNLVTKEFCHAQADAKRSCFPETAVNTAFINMIAGPLDATNGWFDLNNAHSRVRVFQEIPGTVAAEVAKLIVIYTGLMVLPDSPEEYLKKADLFDCIRKMPVQFDSYEVIGGEIDEFICVARRAGDDWFIGSLTNREPREITMDLGFLPEGKKYRATLYGDAENSHFLDNKEAYVIQEMEVDPGTKLTIRMAPGGGHAIHLEKRSI